MSETNAYRIAVIPGDGIGKEVIHEGVRVLTHIAKRADFGLAFDFFPWGSQYYEETGRMMPKDGLDQIKHHQAIYFGAVGWKTVPDHISLWGLRLAITQGFDQWANIRPVKFLPGLRRVLNRPELGDLEWIMIRENSEGEYGGVGGRNFFGRGGGKEKALQTSGFTQEGCERIIRFAFELATKRSRKKVTSATKSNAQQYGMVLWDEIFARVSKDYPDVETEQWLIDSCKSPNPLRLLLAQTSSQISSRISGARLPEALGWPQVRTSTPSGAFPACLSRCTARPPTSPGRASQIRSAP